MRTHTHIYIHRLREDVADCAIVSAAVLLRADAAKNVKGTG